MNAGVLCDRLGIAGEIREAALRAREKTEPLRYEAQEIVAANVLRAFIEEGLPESDLWGSTGYGYDDSAFARYQSLLQRIFGAERALTRLSLVSGTQAIVTAIAACVQPGQTLLSITGAPYDTLRNAIVDAPDSLVKGGIRYSEVPLNGDRIELNATRDRLRDQQPAVIFVQRSRGYAPRPALMLDECARAFAAIKEESPQSVILVDNCYGELVEAQEPTHAGADLVVGSLIKNLGGGLAPGGAYVAGRADLVERIASKHYAAGIGAGIGPSLGYGRALMQGLFVAPLVVEQTLRGLDFFAALFEELGFDVDPKPGARRGDIVQAIRLGDPERLRRFASGLQSAMPLNARFMPEPGAVPGYRVPVLMSSGSFISGATIELSCDAPLRPPYDVYVQGGLTLAHAMTGAVFSARAVMHR
jgi:cystathionine beta-lyase family protein involved in aluminum resistance